jgi:hypothetical protein
MHQLSGVSDSYSSPFLLALLTDRVANVRKVSLFFYLNTSSTNNDGDIALIALSTPSEH